MLAIDRNISGKHVFISGFKIKISNFEIFVGFFVYVNFLPAVFIFDNERVTRKALKFGQVTKRQILALLHAQLNALTVYKQVISLIY